MKPTSNMPLRFIHSSLFPQNCVFLTQIQYLSSPLLPARLPHPSIRDSSLWSLESVKPRPALLDRFPAPGVLRACHSRLMPCSWTDQLLLLLSLPLTVTRLKYAGDAISAMHRQKARIARETLIYTFNLPDNVTVWRCSGIGFGRLCVGSVVWKVIRESGCLWKRKWGSRYARD